MNPDHQKRINAEIERLAMLIALRKDDLKSLRESDHLNSDLVALHDEIFHLSEEKALLQNNQLHKLHRPL